MRKNFTLVFVFLIACTQAERKNSDHQYFDLEGLIDDQVELLSNERYELTKRAQMNDRQEIKVLTPDSLGWNNELKLFRDSDLNKPALNGLYKIKEGPGEEGNNLRETDYIPSPANNKLNVRSLKIFYVDHLEEVRKIKIRALDTNPLFEGERDLTLEFHRDGSGTLILYNYQISGGQKMILLDSVIYTISGSIRKL